MDQDYELIHAVLNNNTYIETRNRDGYSALHIACKIQDISLVRQLIQKGLCVNCGTTPYYSLDKGDETPLIIACKKNNKDIARVLLENGAENRSNIHNDIPLHFACKQGNIELVRMLIQKGAYFDHINHKNNNGKTPLYFCYYNPDMVQLLLANGADINMKDNDGKTILHICCRSLRLENVKFILDMGSNVNTMARRGITPLYEICSLNHKPAVWKKEVTRIAELLLNRGAYVDGLACDNTTPLSLAASNDNIELVRLLINNGANINMANKHGTTPLHKACKSNNIEITELLLKHRANPDVKTKTGKVPLDYIKKNKETFQELFDKYKRYNNRRDLLIYRFVVNKHRHYRDKQRLANGAFTIGGNT
jgi:ankyrin repeat protein